MAIIDSHIPLVDRVLELEELKTHLHNATKGQGNLVFIAGEAGVGKTRLVDELKTYAQSQGIQILQGWSLYESLTPYMPFVEALRSANLEHLFSREDPPKVECVYLITDTGLLIKEVLREETKLDSTIFAGMLTAVGDFVKDSLTMLSGEEKNEALNSLGYENYRILIEVGTNTNLVVILTGKENEFLINDMKEVLANVDQEYGNVLKAWDGDDNSVRGIENVLKPLITSGKYDGIDYAKDDPKIKRNRLFENISLGIERYAKVNPSILCIEDLQWADPSSMALMHYVARNTRKCNLLILGTYRPEDVTAIKEGKAHHLIDAMQLMSREDLYQMIELERLEEDHMDEMLTSLLGKTDFTDEFKKQLYKETEGNPFFMVSLIRMLIEEKTIEMKDDVCTLTKDLKEVHIPSKVHDVIIRRLSRVKEERREVLDIAAVIGEEFTSTLLANTTKLEKVHLLKQLRTLEQSHKLIRSFGQKYKFDHAKIKEILYLKIPEELRMEYHTIIADSIETLNKDNLDDMVEDLAFHYYHCRNREKALPYLLKAAEKAKKDYSNEEAIRFYNEALELEEDEQKRREIFEEIGDIYGLIGDYNKSIESLECGLELARQKNIIAEIKVKIGRICQKKGEYDDSIRISTEALDLVKGDECKEEAEALAAIGNVYQFKGENDRALEYFNKSLMIREKIGDQKGIARIFNGFGILHADKGEYDNALKEFEKSLEIKKKIGDIREIAKSFNNIGLMYNLTGDLDRALGYFERGLKMLKKIGDLRLIGVTLNSIGEMHLIKEQYDEAIKNYEKSMEICDKNQIRRPATYNYCGLAEAYYKKGNLKKAFHFCNMAYDSSKEIGVMENVAHSKRIYGMIYREQKKWEESIENFEDSIRIFNDIKMERGLGKLYYEYGLMWKTKGDSEKAKEHLNKALNIYMKLKLEKHAEKVRKEL
ncbi:MAG: tetratricopeptide repeat protein [Thermoplasmata archaeon]|nr:MAG: tetratricopeptide repeat protein [Thermoplasmata archaeon]